MDRLYDVFLFFCPTDRKKSSKQVQENCASSAAKTEDEGFSVLLELATSSGPFSNDD